MLEGKTILILSPQNWGDMLLSKHHYSINLAKKGNKVYFLNPPRQGSFFKSRQIDITKSEVDNLFVINHAVNFPYNIKFHAIGFFHFFMKFHIKSLLKAISSHIDIVWSFDLGHLYPFNQFPENSLKIYHPVDEPQSIAAINSAIGAEIIFSVTNEILEKYKKFSVPSHLIPHGVNDIFFNEYDKPSKGLIQVGISGNLLRPDLDRETLLEVINDNKEVEFNFFGAYQSSNIGGGDDKQSLAFIESLKEKDNVIFHGMLKQAHLAKSLHQMDAFLICYDVQKDQSKGTNYHKVMEFLSTGKVIVSNNISAYKNLPDLVQMVEERNTNMALPILFKKVVQDLSFYNDSIFVQKRIAFASANTYAEQIKKIEAKLSFQLKTSQ